MTTTINKDCEAGLGRVLKQMGHQLVKGVRAGEFDQLPDDVRRQGRGLAIAEGGP